MRVFEMMRRVLLFSFLGVIITALAAQAANTNPNHDSTQTQAGDCMYCHVSANTGPTLPKQAACLNCHVRWNAATASLQVFGLQQEYGLPPMELLKHEIFSNSGEEIRIYDLAVCFSCHADPAIAPVVSPYHGNKVNGIIWSDNLQDANDDPYAMFYYHPGRNTFNARSYVFNNRTGNFNSKLYQGYGSIVNCAGQTSQDLGKSAANLCVPVPRYRDQLGDVWQFPAPGYELRQTIPFDNFGLDPVPTFIEVPFFAEIPPPTVSDPCVDQDTDGWGVCDAFCDSTGMSCGDCGDTNPTINPGAIDTPCDGIDQDCSGSDAVDATCTDGDADGYTADVDCNDSDPAINPAATDTPCDGIDQDCSGSDAVDATCQTVCADYLDKGTCQLDLACAWSGKPQTGFCQDSVPPMPPEVCDDGIDNDGDGMTDCDDSDCAGIGSCQAPAVCTDFSGDEASCLANGCSWNKGKKTCK